MNIFKKSSKIIWHAGAGIFWTICVLLLLTSVVGAFLNDACSTDEFDELLSPGGDYRAVVLISGCGGFASPQTHIHIERVKNRSISPFSLNETGSLIQVDGKPEDVNFKIHWKSNEELVISDFDFDKMQNVNKKSWGTTLPKVSFEVADS